MEETQPPVNYPGATDWLTLELGGSRITVFPLDGMGARLEAIAAEGSRFRLQASPWYEVVVAPPTPPRRR